MSIKAICFSILVFVTFACEKKEEAPLPVVNFLVDIQLCNGSVCVVRFVDNSENTTAWTWIINNEEVSNSQNFVQSLSPGQQYLVELKGQNSDGVEASKSKYVNL